MLVYDDLEVGIQWQWQALDGVLTKAPLGGEATGPSPVDRAKSGTKRSVLSDGRGAPVAVVAVGANVPDQTLALETVDMANGLRPEKGVKRVQHLCVDAGYAYAEVIAGMVERDYILPLAASTGAHSSGPAREKVPCPPLGGGAPPCLA